MFSQAQPEGAPPSRTARAGAHKATQSDLSRVAQTSNATTRKPESSPRPRELTGTYNETHAPRLVQPVASGTHRPLGAQPRTAGPSRSRVRDRRVRRRSGRERGAPPQPVPGTHRHSLRPRFRLAPEPDAVRSHRLPAGKLSPACLSVAVSVPL